MKAVLVISHGSQSPKTKLEIEDLVKTLQQEKKDIAFRYAFLEIESPNIPEGIDQCVELGAKEIIVLLNFLNSGKHVDVDIPRIVNEAKKKYPNISIQITKPIGQHPGIVPLFINLIHSSHAK